MSHTIHAHFGKTLSQPLSTHFKRAAIAALVGAALISACGGSGSGDTPAVVDMTPFSVRVIGFNDYHGNLESPGTFGSNASIPATSRPAVGGADILAAHIAKLKKEKPHSVVVGAGDLIGATPLVSSLFFDEPSVETLNRIGLEFSAVGNHEFDKGSAELLRLQSGGCKQTGGVQDPNSCKGAAVGTPVPFEGAKFKWLSANVLNSATGKTLLPAYGVKEFNGVKVAFIGMTLQATPGIVTPSGVAGLEFRAEADTVNALIPELRAAGIESVVVLVHQGGFQTGTLSDINRCDGDLAGSDIASIVAKFDDAVDLVISGHTHAAYNCSLPNAKGRKIPVTSTPAFGRVLTAVDLTIDPATRNVTAASANNILASRAADSGVVADPALTKIVDAYKTLVSPIANQVLGGISTALGNTRSDAACNMPAGELIADSQLEATKASNSKFVTCCS